MNSSYRIPDGTWPTFRHDNHVSGYQPLPGQIRRPEIAWREYLGGPIFDAFILDTPVGKRLLLLYGGCVVCHDSDGALVWQSRPLGIEGVIGIGDIDCDGRVEIVVANGKSVFVLSADDGTVLWDVYLGPPFAGGFMFTSALLHHFPRVGRGMQLAIGLLSSKEVVLYDFSTGASSPERLHILWMDDFFHPSVLAADIDGDGEEELIITKYSAVYAFDPVTGVEKSQCRWSSGGTPKRNYGLFQARDLNGDGALDLLILSYVVSRHIAVVENNGRGDLANKWDRFIEHVYPNDEREIRYTYNSCVDIDGDGKLEIVVSIYNEQDDGRWWLEVIDAWSGEIRLRLPDLFLHGIQPAGPDGRSVVLASIESERYPGDITTISMMEWRNEGLHTVWSMENACFMGRFCRTDARTTVFRSELPPNDEVWFAEVDGIESFFLQQADRSLSLLQYEGEGWNVSPIPGTLDTASLIAVDDIDGDGRTELLLCDWMGNLRAVHADGDATMSVRVGTRYRYGASLYFLAKPMGTPVVVESNGDRYCVVPDSGKNIHLFVWDRENDRPLHRWSQPGRGRIGPEEGRHSVSVVEWEGSPGILMSRITDGDAELRLVDLYGMEQAHWTIPSLPGNPPVPRGRVGIHEYAMIDADGGPLLVVSGFRSGSMNSELTVALNAGSGESLWEQIVVNGESEDGRGFGPWNAMTVIGDSKRPELLFLAKDTFCQIDVLSGKALRRPWHLRPYNTAHLRQRGMSMDDFSAYGIPAPVTVDSSGAVAWILLGNYGGLGAINPDHSMRWWRSAPLSMLTSGPGGLADIDNDGITEIGLSYADGDFVCLRADTGDEKWRLQLGQVASDVVACDIDGDGKIEFILATREGELIALGASTTGCGLIKWRLQFDFSLGSPVVADFDGDGCSEVLVMGGDGYLYCIRDKGEGVARDVHTDDE